MSTRSTSRRFAPSCRFAWCAALVGCVLSAGVTGLALAQRAPAAPPTVLRVHARNLDVTIGVLRTYLPVPLKPEAALDSLFGAMGASVRIDAPVDLVVALDGKSTESPGPPLWVASVGVRSVEEVRKQASQSGLPIDNQGVFSRMQLKAGSDTLHCLLGPGSGTGARLACGLSERSREELGGYAVALPALRSPADIRAELYIDTLVQTYDSLWQRALQIAGLMVPQKLQLGQPQFDRALTDATQTLIGQLGAMSRDLRRMTLDLSLTNGGSDAVFTYELAGQSSWWGQSDALMADQPPAAPPALYTGLRKDCGAASFTTGDPRYARQFLGLMAPLLEGFLTHEGLAQADRQAVVDVLRGLSLPDGSLTSVFAELAAPADAKQSDRRGFDRWLGGSTYLLGGDGKGGLTTDWLKSVVAAYKRPGVQNYLRGKWKSVAKTEPLPVLRMQPAAKALGPGATLFTLTLTLPAALERATAGRAGAVAPAAKGASAPWVVHLLSVTRGDQTWMALGSDPNVLTTQLTAQLTVTADATLAKRPGLEALQQPGLRSGGFTSLQSMARYLETAMAMSRMRLPRAGADKPNTEIGQIFNMIPHHGETPLVYRSRVRRAGDGSRSGPLTGEITLQVPRTALEDIVALVMHLAL